MHKTLYRLYRPQNFEDVVGQDIVVLALKSAIKKNRIAHSYLFSGGSGVGKTTLAKIFSKAINCDDNNSQPCNLCRNCEIINLNQTIDIVEMDAASNNGVDQIRQLIDSTQYPPVVCKNKVYIIDEAHMLSIPAFNALLKTLEEPPKNTIFILATTEEHKIPETILSRCQRYNFQKISNKNISELVSSILQKENKDHTKAASELIADMANGSLRRALSMTEKCMHLGSKITVDLINKAYGLLKTSELINLLAAIHNNDKLKIKQILEIINDKGSHYQRILEEILQLLKEILLYSLPKDKIVFKFLTKKNKKELSFTDSFVFEVIKKIKKALSKLVFSSNPKLLFEILIYELASINKNTKKIIINDKKNLDKLIAQEKTSALNWQNASPKPITLTKSSQKNESTILKNFDHKKDNRKLVLNQKTTNNFDDKNQDSKTNNDLKNNLKKSSKIKPFIEKKAQKTESQTKKPSTKEVSLEINDKKINKESLLQTTTSSMILNALLDARKIERQNFQVKLEKIWKLNRDLKNGRWITMLTNSKIVAVSQDSAILLFEHEPSAKMLNNYNLDKEFLTFVKKYFDKFYLIIGTWKEDWKNEVKKFTNLKKANKLPQHKPVLFNGFNQISDEIKEAQNLFGDLLEIKND